MTRIASILLATATVTATFSTPAFALTNNKTCAQVQRDFIRDGRVTTRSRSGAVLPIYGGVPFQFKNRLRCGPKTIKATKFVLSSDKRRCPISASCK